MEVRVAGAAGREVAPAEFGQFYAAHFQRIAKQLHAYLGDAEEAQDLAQEAFCRALDRWARIHTYDDPSAWVRRVAWNLATSALRRRATALRYLSRHRQDPVPGPQPDSVALAGALATLPPRQRRAVVLHHVAQLSTAEIAAQEGVAEGTVRSWLSRGRAALAVRLADDETEFRPAPLSAVQNVVRRRRRARVATLTAAIVAVLAVPVLVSLTRVLPAPPVEPTPSSSVTPVPTTSPAAIFETRRIVVPGFPEATRWFASFTDADHAWAWTDPFALAATADGGRTWRAVSVPATASQSINVYPTDGETVTLNVLVPELEGPDSFLLTTDGGATFATYPQDSPPIQADRADARQRSGGEHYALRCPGQTGFLDGGAAPECDHERLVRIGSGPVDPQPAVGGLPNNPSWLREGGDGRLWILSAFDEFPALQVSTDDARSWQELATPAGEIHDLVTSPDGSDVWLFTSTGVYLLAGGTWQRQNADFGNVQQGACTPLDGGILLIASSGGLSAYQDGASRPIRGIPAGLRSVDRLPDGTLVASTSDSMFLGIGDGLQRSWIQILPSGQS